MKIIFAQDFDFISHSGGAQLTDRAHFLEGIRRGHDIQLWTPSNQFYQHDFTPGTKFIASNPIFLGTDTFQVLLDKKIAYVWLFHDYSPLCKYRLLYPMQAKCRSCYLKERWLPYLMAAKMLIWLSPLHRESWLRVCPELEPLPYHLAPAPVDPDQFFDMKLERSGAVAVESLYPFKGREKVLKWAEAHPEVEISFVGGNPEPHVPLLPNCRDVGIIPSGKMNEVYNRSEIFLHLPQNPMPFDRTVAEAYLAGCKIIGNQLIGALSYSWFTSRELVAEECRKSSQDLWQALEEVFS